MGSKKDLGVADEHTYNKDLTILEQHDLSQQIQFFLRERDIITYVKFKISNLLDSILPNSKKLSELNNELISKYGKGDGTIDQFIQDPDNKDKKIENSNWKLFRDEIKPVEEDKGTIQFKQLPISSIMKLKIGGYPLVYKLFYEDPAAEIIFNKMLAAEAKDDEEEEKAK